jgi:hypothetical protein
MGRSAVRAAVISIALESRENIRTMRCYILARSRTLSDLLVETILRIILLRRSGRALTPAWLAVFAFALCGTLTYAVDHERYSPTTSELQQPLGEDTAAPQDRRISVQAPTSREAKHGPTGSTDAVLPNLVSSAHRNDGTVSVGTDPVFVFKRRLTSSALARAPPC